MFDTHNLSALYTYNIKCVQSQVLIFSMIINKSEHKLQKGTGFHLDILLMGVFALINGFMGLPFMTCATVRSVSHTSALTAITRNVAPGEQPKLERVIEQRVSNLVVHILIGKSNACFKLFVIYILIILYMQVKYVYL